MEFVARRADHRVRRSTAAERPPASGVVHASVRSGAARASEGDHPSRPQAIEHPRRDWTTATPHVKVIDFGIAKAIDSRADRNTMFTRFRPARSARPNTWARTGRGGIGRRCRHARGCLFAGRGVVRAADRCAAVRCATAAQRGIRGDSADHPRSRSAAIRARGCRAWARPPKIAMLRRTRRWMRWSAELKHELEWIPLKAMRKDRAASLRDRDRAVRRYSELSRQSSAAAGPESNVYRAHKFLRAQPPGGCRGGECNDARDCRRDRDGVAGGARGAEARVRAALLAVQGQKQQTDAANLSLGAVNGFLTRDVLGSADLDVTRGKPLSVVERARQRRDRSRAGSRAMRIGSVDSDRARQRVSVARAGSSSTFARAARRSIFQRRSRPGER